MLDFDLNDKQFSSSSNEHGVSNADTVFHYYMDGQLITGTYAGGRVLKGQLIGKPTSRDTLELRFQCLTTEGEFLSGASRGRVHLNPAGLLELHFAWWWLVGPGKGGESSYVQQA